MKIRHWSSLNGSGMNHVASACAEAERRLGHDTRVVDIANSISWEETLDADIQVAHTDFPESVRDKVPNAKVVFVAHGTPEHVFEMTIPNFERPGYAPGDGWMLLRQWLRTADAIVTFWPRHAALYQSLMPKGSNAVHTVPLGVDKAFWAAGKNPGKYAGQPSVWTSENQHRIKWILDVLLAWPFTEDGARFARLHAHYIPPILHRFFIDLANSNGAAARAYLSSATFAHDALRDIWKGFDFFLSPVQKGDHNNIFMQAAATGLKTISYRGNAYADFWIPEGDQREMARELVKIFRGEVEARTDKLPIPDFDDMGRAMVKIYEQVLGKAPLAIVPDEPAPLSTDPPAALFGT